jgi:hypothetical protein
MDPLPEWIMPNLDFTTDADGESILKKTQINVLVSALMASITAMKEEIQRGSLEFECIHSQRATLILLLTHRDWNTANAAHSNRNLPNTSNEQPFIVQLFFWFLQHAPKESHQSMEAALLNNLGVLHHLQSLLRSPESSWKSEEQASSESSKSAEERFSLKEAGNKPSETTKPLQVTEQLQTTEPLQMAEQSQSQVTEQSCRIEDQPSYATSSQTAKDQQPNATVLKKAEDQPSYATSSQTAKDQQPNATVLKKAEDQPSYATSSQTAKDQQPNATLLKKTEDQPSSMSELRAPWTPNLDHRNLFYQSEAYYKQALATMKNDESVEGQMTLHNLFLLYTHWNKPRPRALAQRRIQKLAGK